MSNLRTINDIVLAANTYLDNYDGKNVTKSSVAVQDNIINPSGVGYAILIDVFVNERAVQFKIRDPELLVEYQLVLKPWAAGFHVNYWFDGTGKAPWKVTLNISASYDMDEGEYFQLSTIRNLEHFKFSDISEIEKLQDRFFKHFDIIPCAFEKKVGYEY